jgi:hypothetical protein
MAAMGQIKELGGALNAEAMLRRQYYGVMLTDTNNFMNAQRSAMSQKTAGVSGSGSVRVSGKKVAGFPVVGKTELGGYADRPGLWMRGEKGREFTLNNSTTMALESLIGGRLSQQALLMTAAGGGGSGKGVTWNDYRHFEADVSQASRDAIFKDTISILDRAMQSAGAR